ncbi:MAG: primosomal protein N' [Pseudomonadota bacterium]
MTNRIICKVAVAVPLLRVFDYFSSTPLLEGQRVRVPFGRRHEVGIVVDGTASSDIDQSRIKSISEVIDDAPLLDANTLAVLTFAASYYQHPIGEVIVGTLPKRLREGAPAEDIVQMVRLTEQAQPDDPTLARAPRQKAIVSRLNGADGPLPVAQLKSLHRSVPAALRRLEQRGWLTRYEQRAGGARDFRHDNVAKGPELSDAQASALAAINASSNFQTFVLNGVTGSGKTEVYLRAIEHVLKAGRQALVLVPEIALTPQLVTRFERRFAAPIVALHSGLNQTERASAWRDARAGRAAVVIGTRSAVFTPLHTPGIVVVDEEHDGSFKQQEGFRYHARDVAVYLARRHDIPIVMGSATPTLESLHNVAAGRYKALELPERVGPGTDPHLQLVDLREESIENGLSATLVNAMRRHVDEGAQVMLFLNRRGYAPAWFCSGCGAIARCTDCDANMTYHHRHGALRCHHCGSARKAPETCNECGATHKPVGQGTERIEALLAELFPRARVARMDRDSTRRRGALATTLNRMRKGQIDILVGTQMLTKGHHFPGVAMVGVLNADHGLFSADFRADERLAQTLVQVCGRAGRGDRAGEVLIQTSFPEHPLFAELINGGYAAFAQRAMQTRREASWPPFAHVALLRARSTRENTGLAALSNLRNALGPLPGVTVLGPADAPMRFRAARFHSQLLLQSGDRRQLANALFRLRAQINDLTRNNRVRISIDVDPVDLY